MSCMSTVIDGVSRMRSIIDGLGSFKPSITEFPSFAQFWLLFYYLPLPSSDTHAFTVVITFELLTATPYQLYLISAPVSPEFLLSHPFNLNMVSCSLCVQQLPSSLT